jgi:hypothetical protein
MSGIYDVTLAAGVAINVPVLGNYIKVRSAAYGLVEIKLDGGESYLLDEGLGVRLPDAKFFRDVQIKNKSSSTQTILIFIGDSRFEDSRITGVVSVVDTAKRTTQDGASFSASCGTSPAATFFGSQQLYNPGGSGKRLIVEAVYANAFAALINTQFGIIATAQVNAAGTAPNHLSGGSATTANINAKDNHATNPQLLISGATGALYAANVAANGQVLWVPKRPVILLPGFGLIAACSNANTSSSAQFDYYEEPL